MDKIKEDDEKAQLRATIAALSIKVSELEQQLIKLSESKPPTAQTNGSPSRQNENTAHGAAKPSPYPPKSLCAVEIPMATTRIVTAQTVSPSDSNTIGICIGGTVLSWIDVCAGLAAKTLARGPCVTASVDAVHFLRPCRVGSVVIVAAMVNRTFRSSMEVGVRVEEECPVTGGRHHCCSAYLTFVAVAPSGGGKRALPRVVPGSSRRLNSIYNDAEHRRAGRLERRERLRNDPEATAAEAACRLLPVTHRIGTPTLPPALRLEGVPIEGPDSRTNIPPSLTTAHATHIIMPQHANSINITFGGQVLRWVEQVAFVVATRVSRGGHILTAAMDEVTFLRPTRVGDTVFLEAQATAVFGSSVEVMISVWGEVPEVGDLFHCGDAYATIVSVNAAGEPVDLPIEIVPQTKEERMRYDGAVARRQGRLKLREALLVDRAKRLSLDEDDYRPEKATRSGFSPRESKVAEEEAAVEATEEAMGDEEAIIQTLAAA